METITALPLHEVLQALQEKKFSCEEYAKALARKIKLNEDLNALLSFNEQAFLQKAKHADEKRSSGKAGVLEGLPLVVKDCINTIDLPTSAGTKALLGKIPKADSPVLAELRQAGAIIAAKSNLHELCFGITSNNACTGAVRNPYNKEKIPGGSSGGSAAAVAAGMFPAGLGTDTGGSVRIPAALCGLYGLRPSIGRYSNSGIVPLSSTRDTIGTITRSAEDLRLLDAVIMKEDIKASLPDLSLKRLRLAIIRNPFWIDLEPAVASTAEGFLKKLTTAGVEILELPFPKLVELNAKISFPIVLYEVRKLLPAYLKENLYNLSYETLAQQVLSPDVKGALQSQLGADAIPESVYQDAINIWRPELQAAYKNFFQSNRLDGIIFPTTALTACDISSGESVTLNGQQMPTFQAYIRNTDPGSNVGIPGITFPIGISPSGNGNGNGLPIGMAIDAPSGHDRNLLSILKAIGSLIPVLARP